MWLPSLTVFVFCPWRAQARGSQNILQTLKQLSDKLRLPAGSEQRLRLLGMGQGEITSVIDKTDDAHRVRNKAGGGGGGLKYKKGCGP